MKKNHFITLVVCVMAGLLFSLGLCMCLLPEWNLFIVGVIFTAIGGAILAVMGVRAYVKNVKHKIPINWNLVGKISYGVVSALIVGLGMAMVMEWKLIIWGILVGVIGILMLLCLIPMFLGFKN